MPWEELTLNDGTTIPTIAFGTWTAGSGQSAIDQVDQALGVGFDHIDTAQSYRNEEEAGKALHESGLAREDVYITTKFSGRDGLSIEESIDRSLNYLGVKYVDLYLIHHPRLATPDIPTAWAQMEKLQAEGKAKSIGVSNFGVKDLATLVASAKVKPAANQILLHPYVYAQQAPILAYAKTQGIAIEAYSVLIPLTHQPGGPVDKPVGAISARLSVTPEQVLLSWAKAKGAIVVTTSSKKERLQGYLSAGDIELTTADIAAIDAAGTVGARRQRARAVVRTAAVLAFAGALAFKAVTWVWPRCM